MREMVEDGELEELLVRDGELGVRSRLARDFFGALVGRLGARPLVSSRDDGRRKAGARGGGGGGGSLRIARRVDLPDNDHDNDDGGGGPRRPEQRGEVRGEREGRGARGRQRRGREGGQAAIGAATPTRMTALPR